MTTRKLESIIELASVLDRQSDFQEILRLITQKAAALFDAETALIMMVNPSTRETIKTIYRQGDPGADHRYRVLHTYLSGWVIENNRGFFSEEIGKDDRFRAELLNDVPVRSAMCGPFRADGILIGTLLLLDSGDRSFGQNDYLLLEKFTAVAAPFLRNIQQIRHYFAAPLPEETLIKKYEAHGLLGRSDRFRNLLQSLEAAARCDVRVLLEGESGTGKELVAKAIHHCSARASNNFVAIDCGAIPRELIESELFGHVKGAFTGAGESRKGLMEEASGGTLFMDEITNLPMEVQSKFLRVLQENEIRPLGSNRSRKIDVRVIAASSKPLKELVDQDLFREDLFYRLYVYPIEIPSLSERRKDIPYLANHFLRKFSAEQQKKASDFSPEILEFLKNHPWRGNVRELENLVERLVTMAPPEARSIHINLLPEKLCSELESNRQHERTINTPPPLRETVASAEKQAILDALVLCDWNQSRAARMLQISEHSIRYKMKNLGITHPDKS
ncbi:MAG: sigma-54-dependent Fis family transcriptional regulator [Bacteroidales bacterium]